MSEIGNRINKPSLFPVLLVIPCYTPLCRNNLNDTAAIIGMGITHCLIHFRVEHHTK